MTCCTVNIQPSKRVSDQTAYTGPTRQHRARSYRSGILSICPERSRSWTVVGTDHTDHLSEVWSVDLYDLYDVFPVQFIISIYIMNCSGNTSYTWSVRSVMICMIYSQYSSWSRSARQGRYTPDVHDLDNLSEAWTTPTSRQDSTHIRETVEKR